MQSHDLSQNSSKKRILIVLRRLGMGGIEQATKTLAQAFVKEGHEVHVMILKGKIGYELPAPINLHNIDLEKIQRRSAIGLFWYLLSRMLLRNIIPNSGFLWQGMLCSNIFTKHVEKIEKQHGKFDLILVRGQGAYELIWKTQDTRLWRTVESAGTTSKGLVTSWLRHKLYNNHQIICVSEGAKNQLLNSLSNKTKITDCQVIYNAVPLEKIRELAKLPCEPNFNQPFLVHVARLVPVKRQLLLLEAYNLAYQQGLKLPLVIIGDGSEKQQLITATNKLGLTNLVHFIGQQQNPYPWIAKACALVISSSSEGLGLVLIEALALGTQGVAIDVPGGIREVLVEEQRSLLAENSTQDLANKIIQAVNYPVKVKPKWLEKFSEKEITSQYIKLIEKSNK